MQRLKSKLRAHANTSAILPSSRHLPEVLNRMTLIPQLWPGQSRTGSLFVFPQAIVTRFEMHAHPKRVPALFTPFVFSGLWLKFGWEGFPAERRKPRRNGGGCSSHPRLIVSPRLVRVINSLWNKRGEVRPPSITPDSHTLGFSLAETVWNVECPVNGHTAFISVEQAKKTKQTKKKPTNLFEAHRKWRLNCKKKKNKYIHTWRKKGKERLPAFTWNGDIDYDDHHAQDDGDDAEQTGQSAQPAGPVNVPHLQAVPGLEKNQTDQ